MILTINQYQAIVSVSAVTPVPPPDLPNWATQIDSIILIVSYLFPRLVGLFATIGVPLAGFTYYGVRLGRAVFPGLFSKTQLDEIIEAAALEIKDRHPELHKNTIKKALRDPHSIAQLVDADPKNLIDLLS